MFVIAAHDNNKRVQYVHFWWPKFAEIHNVHCFMLVFLLLPPIISVNCECSILKIPFILNLCRLQNILFRATEIALVADNYIYVLNKNKEFTISFLFAPQKSYYYYYFPFWNLLSPVCILRYSRPISTWMYYVQKDEICIIVLRWFYSSLLCIKTCWGKNIFERKIKRQKIWHVFYIAICLYVICIYK